MNFAYSQTVGSPTRKAVLVTLANMADHRGQCFPSIQYIVDRTELSRRSVTRALGQLADAGHIEITTRMGKTGQRSSLYVLDCSGVTESPAPHDTVTLPHDTQSPITITNNQLTEKTMSDSDESDAQFEEIWKSRPRRPNESKPAGKKAYLARRREGRSHDELVAGQAKYKKYCEATHTKPQHIKHFSTFFNKDGHWSLEWTYTESMQHEAIPRDDDQMVAWGNKNGYGPFAPHMTYDQIRTQLQSAVTLRKDKAA